MGFSDCLIRELSPQQLTVFEKIYKVLHNDETIGRGIDIMNERLEQSNFKEIFLSSHSGFISYLLCCPRLEEWTDYSIAVVTILDDLFQDKFVAESSIVKDSQLISSLTDAIDSSFAMSNAQSQQLIRFIANFIGENSEYASSFNQLIVPLMNLVEPSNQSHLLAASAITNIIQPSNARGQIVFLKARGIEKAVQMLSSTDSEENLMGIKLLYQLLIQPDERARTVFVKKMFEQESFLTTLTQLISRSEGLLAELLVTVVYTLTLVRGNEMKFEESGLIFELFEFMDYPYNERTTPATFSWAVNALFSILFEKRLYPQMKMIGLGSRLTTLLENYKQFNPQIVGSIIGIIRYLVSYEPMQMEFVVLNCVQKMEDISKDGEVDKQTRMIATSIAQLLNNDKNMKMWEEIKEKMKNNNEESKLLAQAKQAQEEQKTEEKTPRATSQNPRDLFKTVGHKTGKRLSMIGNKVKVPTTQTHEKKVVKSNRMSVSDLKMLLNNPNNDEEQMKILSEFNLKKAKRFHIIQEMYTTEKTYVESMKQCLDKMYPFIKETLPNDVTTIFSNFAEVYDVHTKLFDKISDRWLSQKEEAFVSVADIFIDFFQLKEVYTVYARYLVEADDGIQFNFADKGPEVKAQLSKWAGECLILPNFLILPVQRFPRYVMLLESLLKATPPIEEYDYLKEALQDGRDLTMKLNAAKKVIQDKKFLDHYNTVVTDIEKNENRQFIKEGTLTVKEKSKVVYQCVLMSDGLFVLQPDKKDKKIFHIKFFCKKGEARLVEWKKKLPKDVTAIICFALPEGKKEKNIQIIFEFGSDFEGWSSSINSLFMC
ncbi:Rho/RAC guanine nucleotide exchange factor, putative [Entamoeba invadens IP1]|uniref:Rho/RAC guanine nucleotide exchange factor, putative n=1 Tax=Entamoeba invadens IP1 TaxID=370355 RepID=A0A0A1U5Q0_ENTIV|nr:Rho/RAC guanine nucleotide exchange factor, putative [Entamoeba invadens IP1]ELP89638.1 Rho/RAC guanine nucleotide exchange factor, putative [Entamoeba invadens IP1]|eukprot:XP_004256409.1 Rho/RAC guanine nucleotide exchange factor, putative [Entamoeba invadens IP1]